MHLSTTGAILAGMFAVIRIRFSWYCRTLKAALWLIFHPFRFGEPVASWLQWIVSILLALGIITAGVYGTAAATWALWGDPVKIWLGLLSFTTVLGFWATLRLQAKLKPFRHPLPGNRDDIVRLLTEFEQEADVYLQKCASAGFPPSLRFMDWSRRPPVNRVVKRIQAEFRVASTEDRKAAWVEFQSHIEDILTRGRNVTKQTLPDLRGELKTTVSKFLIALDRGDI